MVWAILVFLGVPLWLCAAGITITVLKNRGLQKRPGDIPIRVKPSGRRAGHVAMRSGSRTCSPGERARPPGTKASSM